MGIVETPKPETHAAVTTPDPQPHAGTGRVRRILKRLVRAALYLVGSIVAVILFYIVFLLRFPQDTPQGRQALAGPVPGFEIPDNCPVESVGANPYKGADFEGYTVHRYRFEPETDEITEFFVDWFEPIGEQPDPGYPLLMNSPITGGGMEIENIFSRYFADRGIAVCLVHRPKAYDREAMRLDKAGFWWRMMARQSRIAYHWALAREGIDAQRTASFGISNGGFRNTFFAACEPNVKAHVLCLAGGDLPEMFAVSDFVVRARQHEMQERGLDEAAFRDWLREVVDLEPMDYAAYVDPASVLMICARFDTTVPYKNGLKLREALGRPEFVALPAGHYTSAFAIPYIKRAALGFMRQRFEAG